MRKVKQSVEKISDYLKGYSAFSVSDIQRLHKECDDYERCRALECTIAYKCTGLYPYDEQLLGAEVLGQSAIAQMRTGEGKTLVSVLAVPALLNKYKQVHIVTANEYLATRDYQFGKATFEALGYKVGLNLSTSGVREKKDAYLCDVVYSTASELGFDYLRDHMVKYVEERVCQYGQKDVACIIDEIDSVLIDEARTPLVIAGTKDGSKLALEQAERFVCSLKPEDVEVNVAKRYVVLTESGLKAFVDKFGHSNYVSNMHLVTQALQAHHLYHKDVEYVLVKNKDKTTLELVDRNTGRVMTGRRFSNGLHQALEMKHQRDGVEVKEDTQTIASITIQHYFREYGLLSGMTGTAMANRNEFLEMYGLNVVEIPTHMPYIRVDEKPIWFLNRQSKDKYFVEELLPKLRGEDENPVLIGTTSVAYSKALTMQLLQKGYKVALLNATQDKEEAKIVAEAGKKGMITVSTNMAGRGTDIVVDKGLELIVVNMDVNESRRIDEQLYGRTARQGAKGTTYTLIALDDTVFTKYDGGHLQNFAKRWGLTSENINAYQGSLKRRLSDLMDIVEGIHFDTRKNAVRYDGVLARQRERFYALRENVICSLDKQEALVEYYLCGRSDAIEQYMMFKQSLRDAVFKEMTTALLLESLDKAYMNLIEQVDALAKGVMFSGYSGKHPLVVYYLETERYFETFEAQVGVYLAETLVTLKTYQAEKLERVDVFDNAFRG